MNDNIQKNRLIYNRLPRSDEHLLVLMTGARQTGKTTSARYLYNDLAYFNLDSIEYRGYLSRISSFQWQARVGKAIIDEVQKEPAILEKIKYSYDEGETIFSVLLGSAQIMLLKQIQESLAGRVFIYELWPLTLSELACGIGEEIRLSLLDRILSEESVE